MAQASSTSPRRLKIRKYPNRRYYDITRSRHVTLEEIYALIREGCEIQVTDSRSGQDITPKVLAQIIIELDSPKLGVFPVPMLHRLLQANREIVTDFVEKYFNQPLGAFLDSQKNMEQYFRHAIGIPNPSSNVANWARMMWGPFSPAFWSGARSGAASSEAGPGVAEPSSAAPSAAPASSTPSESSSEHELHQQLEVLRRQVADLQLRLASQRKKSKSNRRS